ncbi:RluA family pseudouridine synthase [Kaistia algarum]|uniref:RluA family pseudouridine synthase n=1 Tax=Kaistia algarum TaxID=2083279 RepID=UPI000CE8E497|nr:RluA family pseudouridine synthase [Kaistia algarum]MCX5515281.1 RluA family pseudouridine synthase [Kaistia algarum]PPE77703.1 RluA family pseudouridine synthase [Kaistia algarum]
MASVVTKTVGPDEADMRLDRWFKQHYPGLSFGHLQKLVRSGQVRVDGGRAKTSDRVSPGQLVRIPPLGVDEAGGSPHVARPAGARGSDADALMAMLLYEDDHVYVFNKPWGLAVQGGSGLSTHVDAMLEALRDPKGQKPRLVHRLDRETSGVLVVARTRLAASRLAASFRARTTKKVYWALVKGVPRPPQGRVSTWLAREESSEKMKIARHGEDDASHAVSLYSVVDNAGPNFSWLTMRPVTGRTHQLRAHAAHIGHPILGDSKYFEADSNWDFPGGMQNKLHLHARRIIIPHPSGKGTLDVTAPLSPHMLQSWNLLGFDSDLGETGAPDEE